MRYLKYLNEKTFNIDKDVDFLYKKSGLDKFVKFIKNREVEKIFKQLEKSEVNGENVFLSITSKKLTTNDSKQAHNIKPVKIKVGIFSDGNYYSPTNNYIQISLHHGAFNLLKGKEFDMETLSNFLNTQFKRFSNEFKETSIKGSISHELSHWIDDVFRNSKIEKRLTKAAETNDKKVLIGDAPDVNKTEFEVNAQIHAIKVLKRLLSKKEYEELDWGEMVKLKSSLMNTFNNFKNEKQYTEFMKSFVKRLNRENLLSKGMKKVPSWKEMQILLTEI